MMYKARISIGVPGYHKPGRYFNVPVKELINEESGVYRTPASLVVISNVQGDFLGFVRLLISKKIIDDQLMWSFENGHLALLGNVLGDNCGEECLWLIYSLEEQARLAGGFVHFIPGTAELKLSDSDWSCLHPKYAQKDSAKGSTALYGGNAELARWIKSKNWVEKLGDLLLINQDVFNTSLRPCDGKKNTLVRLLQVPGKGSLFGRDAISALKDGTVGESADSIFHMLNQLYDCKTILFAGTSLFVCRMQEQAKFWVSEPDLLPDIVCLLVQERQIYRLQRGKRRIPLIGE